MYIPKITLNVLGKEWIFSCTTVLLGSQMRNNVVIKYLQVLVGKLIYPFQGLFYDAVQPLYCIPDNLHYSNIFILTSVCSLDCMRHKPP